MRIDNGVDCQWPIRRPDSSAAARSRLGIGAGKRIFVSIGAMRGTVPETAQKAHDVLLRAWVAGRLGEQGNSELHLLGNGNLRPELEDRVRHQKSVRFHGVVANTSDWLLAADWFVMPSRYEGLPIAGIEAVCTGTPCIFSDIPPLRELEPGAVLYCPPDDAIALQVALLGAARRHEYVAEAKIAAVRDEYSLERAAERYLEAYGTT
jgi:glycosyltransferase involved in cell wall biosynthesis